MMAEVRSMEQDTTQHEKSVGDAVLTEGVRHVDVVHVSLAGLSAIVAFLLFAIALPVFEKPPVTHPLSFAVMVIVSFIGIIGLYVLNFRVHKHVTDQARLTEVLVNSLGQGFVVFDREGVCGNVYSQACLDLLETVPAGKNITDVLQIPEENKSDFKDWLEVLFQPDHALSFDDVVRFFPSFFSHSSQRRVSLIYRPLYGKSGLLRNLVLIATDQTEEYAARQAAAHQQNFAEMICRIFKDRNQFRSTLEHVRSFLQESENLDENTLNVPNLLRGIHTLKASLKQFNLTDFSEIMHQVETDLRGPEVNSKTDFLARLTPCRQKIASALARTNEEISSLIGKECEWRGTVREIVENDIYAFAEELIAVKADPELVQRYLEVIVAVPIRECFHSFERELRELVGMMDKQVKPIIFEGTNPRVLTKSLQNLLFSLTHISRNISDHGIEPPVTRMARGKDSAGQVKILFEIVSSLRGEGEQDLRIVISDDGNGIDPTRVREKLAIQDPEGEWRFEDDKKVIQRILTFGFTTMDKVTALSGRGVGMEAVELEVSKLNGSIAVSSELYKGATFEIKVPYSMSLKGS
ncbi:MAG TPA: hypothetical protein DD400_05685 [Rhodospirillaceae bacterium]|nr:hypothetical protein [Rhodospirillaceae bacterium]